MIYRNGAVPMTFSDRLHGLSNRAIFNDPERPQT